MRVLLLALAAALLLGAAPPVREARFAFVEYRGADPVDGATPMRADQYRNPILQGFYPDPSVTRVGDDFYLVNSTFSWFPGIPVWHSRDLVGWRQIGNAIDRPGQLNFAGRGMSEGVFAPAITHHDGRFYIVNTCVGCGGNYVITARDPAGPWSDPVFLPTLAGGIDPSLFFDDDGTAWIVFNDAPEGTPRYDGHRAIWIQRFDAARLATVGDRRVLIDGGVDPAAKPIWVEGPHLFRKDGWYYLMCAEGGTGDRHSEVIFRSRRPDGGFTPGPNNPILTQRDLPGARLSPITSTGHADLTQAPDGRWWAVFLGTRPYAGDLYNTGRETFLLPVTWRDGWPTILPPSTPVPYVAARPTSRRDAAAPAQSGAFVWRDSFARLSPAWVMMRTPGTRWFRTGAAGLRLAARSVALGDHGNPSFLARRQQHAHATVTTRVDSAGLIAGDRAGLAVVQNDAAWYAVAVEQGRGTRRAVLLARTVAADPNGGRVVAAAALPARGAVELRLAAAGATYRFDYAVAGRWHTLGGEQDGTVLSTAKAGGFVGTMIGPFATAAR